MKRFFFSIIICTTLLWNETSHAVGELGENNGFNNNPHNLSSRSGNTKKAVTETQICIFCHIPHGAVANAPLWGRPDPTGSFDIRAGLGISDPGIVNTTLYSTAADYPNGASKLCLSCHDGVTAMGILANGDELDMSGGNALQIDLAISHPISFVYNSNVKTHLGSSYLWPTTAYLDNNSRVQCTICHQPHQDTKSGTYSLPFWRGAGTNDVTEYNAICTACHTATPSIVNEHNF